MLQVRSAKHYEMVVRKESLSQREKTDFQEKLEDITSQPEFAALRKNYERNALIGKVGLVSIPIGLGLNLLEIGLGKLPAPPRLW